MVDINTDFVQNILRDYFKDDSIEVENLNIVPAVGKGENFMSIVHKVSVEGKKKFNNKDKVFRLPLFTKRQFKSSDARAVFQSDTMFNNEAVAYNEILPALENALREPLALSRAYKADQNIIILEDLSCEGYTMEDKVKNLDIAQCEAVLRELARLHSASYILKEENPKKFTILSGKIKEVFSPENKIMKIYFKRSLEATTDFLKALPQNYEIKRLTEMLNKEKETIISDFYKIFETKTKNDVFNHGDTWMNNILFKNSSPISVKLVDLQVMRFLSPAADLSYFLYINLHPTLRKEKLNYFLSYYLNIVHQNLKKHGLHKQIQILNINWLKAEMSRFSKFGFLFGLMVMPVFYMDKEDLQDIEQITEKDLHANDEPNNIQPINSEDYEKIRLEYLRNYFENNLNTYK